MQFKYRFTVFTPCYNSEKFIHRVFESLETQSYRNFEWLVINDASNDDTGKLLREYASKASYPIRIINNTENKMLYYNFNVAFEIAQGELMIFAGHDDRFHKDTLEIFDRIWLEYGKDNISGISCLCKDQNGKIIGKKFPFEIAVSNYFDMYVKYIYRQERFGCTRTDILRKYKFDLKKGYVREGFLWEKIGLKYSTIYLNKVLRTYYIEPENLNALTKSNRYKIAPIAYLTYLDWINIYIKRIKGNYIFILRFHFAFVFYTFILKKNIFKTNQEIIKTSSKYINFLFIPFAFSLYCFMKIFNKL